MYKTFLEVAKQIKYNFNFIPLLYGSLGLQVRANLNLHPQDIDVLIPQRYLDDEWQDILSMMTQLKFELVNLEEHEFVREGFHIAFASIEDLESFAGIDLEEIEVIKEKEIEYYLLNEKEYLKVYSTSINDSYRKDKNNGKDKEKIELLQTLVLERNEEL